MLRNSKTSQYVADLHASESSQRMRQRVLLEWSLKTKNKPSNTTSLGKAGHIRQYHVHQEEQNEQQITMKNTTADSHKLPHYTILRKSSIFQEELLCKHMEGTRWQMRLLSAEPWLQLSDVLWDQNLVDIILLKVTKTKQFRKHLWT